uniref:Short transient receptor potential channel 5-like n=1 Tax=Saccoglossus kowalevskii TaxID=10224 RepID=A0ABM0MP13_SACKO|nr:PREDICTED: short transient receptor potential channel 5-like [Saccoglossus kowalevskii]
MSFKMNNRNKHTDDLEGMNKERLAKEKSYIEAVQSGDAAAVKQFMRQKSTFDIDATDGNGKNALGLAIINGQLDIIKLLLQHGVELGDALLRAVDVNFVKAVDVICQHIKLLKEDDVDHINACADNEDFPPGQTPLILAADRNNYEYILLQNGATIEDPDTDVTLASAHGLQRSLRELQIYKAIASESFICLTSHDPINTAFQLSHRLKKMAKKDVEFSPEYEKLEEECQTFAAELLKQTRSEHEITTVLTHDPGVWAKSDEVDTIMPHKAALAVKYKQKKFVANPSFQQLMYNRWYRGITGWDEWTFSKRFLFSVAMTWREFKEIWSGGIKNYCSDTWNVLDFLQLGLYWASFTFFFYAMGIEATADPDITPANDTSWWNITVSNVTLYDLIETFEEGADELMSKPLAPENIIAFGRALFASTSEFFYSAVNNEETRMQWPGSDPNLIAEALFAMANIMSFLRLIHIMVINRHVGPLQISLSGMIYDIAKFLCIFFLMLLAFAVGLTQLYKFYASDSSFACITENIEDSGAKYRCTHPFDGLMQTVRTLYWSLFGLIDLEVLSVEADHSFTVSVGELTFALYHVCAIIVLLNALIAMMSNTYTRVEENADAEWKFYRTVLWLGFMGSDTVLPPPFNLIPSTRSIKRVLSCDCFHKKTKKDNSDIIESLQTQYEAVLRQLTLRHISDKRADGYEEEGAGVTQADIMAIKQDMSSFRFEVSTSINKMNTVLVKMLSLIEKGVVPDDDSAPSLNSAESYETSLGDLTDVGAIPSKRFYDNKETHI